MELFRDFFRPILLGSFRVDGWPEAIWRDELFVALAPLPSIRRHARAMSQHASHLDHLQQFGLPLAERIVMARGDFGKAGGETPGARQPVSRLAMIDAQHRRFDAYHLVTAYVFRGEYLVVLWGERFDQTQSADIVHQPHGVAAIFTQLEK